MERRLKEENIKILKLLEELALKLNISVEYVQLLPQYGEGGLCRIIDKYRIIIEKRLHDSTKIELLINELKNFNLDNTFIPPLLRDMFNKTS